MRHSQLVGFLLLLMIGIPWRAWSSADENKPLKPVWSSEQAAEVRDAVAADGRLFLALADRVAAHRSKTGRMLWSVELPAPLSVSADNDHVWVALERKIVLLAADSGEQLGEGELPAGETILAPTPLGDRLLAQSGAGSLLLDAESLKILHQNAEPLFGEHAAMLRQTGYWKARVDLSRELIFFAPPGQLTAVSLKSGQPVFTVALQERPFGWPTVYEDRVFLRDAEGLTCRQTSDGEPLWRNKLTPTKAPYPLLVINREDYPTKRTLPWYLSFWLWLKSLFGLGDPSTLFLQTAEGLAFHLTQRAKVKYNYPLPDEPRPLADAGADAYWLYTFTDTRDGQEKSSLLRMNKKSRQLYGRSVTPGRATGLFVMGRRWLFAEMSPGVLVGLDQDECDRKRVYEIPDDRLVGLFSDEKVMIVVSGKGHVAAFNRY